MDDSKTNSFSSTIQLLLDSQVEFPQKLRQHFVFKSGEVSNSFKFIGRLSSKRVFCDGSNDSEADVGLKQMMVRLAMMIACTKGAEGIGSMMEALEESGNSRLISDFRAWIKQDFDTDIESNFGQSKEAGSSAQAKTSQVLAAQARKNNEPSSCGAKLVDKILSRLDDDLKEQLQGYFNGRAGDIVNATKCPEKSYARKNNNPIAVESLAPQRRPTATGLFASTSKGLISLDLRTLEPTALTSECTLAVAVNHNLQKLYWSEGYPKSCIRRSNFDGSTKETIVPKTGGAIHTLKIDESSGNVYFALYSSHEIKVCNALGKECTVVISNSSLVNQPVDIALDSEKGFMYWGNRRRSSPHSIVRANLDGSNSTVISTGFKNLCGITLDQPSKRILYWTDLISPTIGTIGTIDVDDDKKRTLVETYSGLWGIQVNTENIYFSNFNSVNIQSVDRKSGQELKTIFNTTGRVKHLALFTANVKTP